MMHRNSQWNDEVIDLENQVTHLLNQLEAVKTWINLNTDVHVWEEHRIKELWKILEAEQ